MIKFSLFYWLIMTPRPRFFKNLKLSFNLPRTVGICSNSKLFLFKIYFNRDRVVKFEV